MNAESDPKPPRRNSASAGIAAAVVFLVVYLPFTYFVFIGYGLSGGRASAAGILFGSALYAAVPAVIAWALVRLLGRPSK